LALAQSRRFFIISLAARSKSETLIINFKRAPRANRDRAAAAVATVTAAVANRAGLVGGKSAEE
jgi:hypothetical protein